MGIIDLISRVLRRPTPSVREPSVDWVALDAEMAAWGLENPSPPAQPEEADWAAVKASLDALAANVLADIHETALPPSLEPDADLLFLYAIGVPNGELLALALARLTAALAVCPISLVGPFRLFDTPDHRKAMVHNDATLVAAVETFLGVDDDFRASAPDAKTREEAVGITAEKYAMPEADVERVVNMMLGSDIRWLRLRWMTRYPHYEDLNRQLACGAPTAFAEVWDHIPMLTEADREAARACYDAL